jgi:hypothetical protein
MPRQHASIGNPIGLKEFTETLLELERQDEHSNKNIVE